MNPITRESIQAFSDRFDAAPDSRLRMNAITSAGVDAVALDYEMQRRMRYSFSVELETGKVTNQKSSGRCWIFAALNTMRAKIMHDLNLENFELSQNYVFFWDQFEKSHFFLCSILDTLDKERDSRIVHYLLHNPLGDGGQWDMLRNVVEKYGVVPKDCMPESFHSSNTGRMNKFITLKLREGAAKLRDMHAAGASKNKLIEEKQEILYAVYQILCLTLGKPPMRIVFEARDKDKKFIRDADITPQAFFKKYVGWNFDDYISLINAPTEDKPYGKTYTVDYLGSVVEGRAVRYLNAPIDVLKKAAIAQMQAGQPVWFGCDVGQWLTREQGAMDTAGLDYARALGVEFGMTKAQRLDYGDSLMTHAMVFQGVNLDDEGKPTRWKVENSWSDKSGNEGWFIMSDAWFDQYMYQIVVKKEFLPQEWVEAYEQAPIHLKPWDPMGSLAL